MKKLLLFLLIALFVPIVFGANITHPASNNSFWNQPIKVDALIRWANISSASSMGMTIDRDIIIATPNVSEINVQNDDTGWNSAESRCDENDSVMLTVPIPLGLRIPDTNGAWGTTPNNGLAVLDADGITVQNTQPACKNADTYMNSQFTFNSENLFGYMQRGAHGGSHLSTYAGTLTCGELVPNSRIRHALKINLYGAENFNYTTSDNCNYWPATNCDSGYTGSGSNRYTGQNNWSKIGGLYTFANYSTYQAVNATLKTEPARILARAMWEYGAYAVDNTAWDVYALVVAEASYQEANGLIRNCSVEREFNQTWGFEIEQSSSSHNWSTDMYRIFSNLSVVVSNANNSEGGGNGAFRFETLDTNQAPVIDSCSIYSSGTYNDTSVNFSSICPINDPNNDRVFNTTWWNNSLSSKSPMLLFDFNVNNATDLSGKGFHGTISNGTWNDTDVDGSGAMQIRASGNITLGLLSDQRLALQNLTIYLRYRPAGKDNGNHELVSLGDRLGLGLGTVAGSQNCLSGTDKNNVFCAFWYNGSEFQNISSTFNITSGIMYALAFVSNGSQRMLYVDGVLHAKRTVNPADTIVYLTTRNSTIGSSFDGKFNANGSFGEVRLYNYSMNGDEINQLNNSRDIRLPSSVTNTNDFWQLNVISSDGLLYSGIKSTQLVIQNDSCLPGQVFFTENMFLLVNTTFCNPGYPLMYNDSDSNGLMEIGANGVTVDFNGITVIGNYTSGSFLINTSIFNSTIVKNGSIGGFDRGFSRYSPGLGAAFFTVIEYMNLSGFINEAINFDNYDNSTIQFNRIDNATYVAIRVHSTDRTTVKYNWINSTIGDSYASIQVDGRNNLIEKNTIYITDDDVEGIRLVDDSTFLVHNNTFMNNSIFGNKSGYGIGVDADNANGNQFLNNNLTNLSRAINGFRNRTVFRGNTVNWCHDVCVFFGTNDWFNSAENNTFQGNGSKTVVRFFNSELNNFTSNNVRNFATGSLVDTNSEDDLVNLNLFFQTSVGIQVRANSSRFEFNKFIEVNRTIQIFAGGNNTFAFNNHSSYGLVNISLLTNSSHWDYSESGYQVVLSGLSNAFFNFSFSGLKNFSIAGNSVTWNLSQPNNDAKNTTDSSLICSDVISCNVGFAPNVQVELGDFLDDSIGDAVENAESCAADNTLFANSLIVLIPVIVTVLFIVLAFMIFHGQANAFDFKQIAVGPGGVIMLIAVGILTAVGVMILSNIC